MKTNVGTADRVVRIVAALAAFALGYAFQSWWGLIGIVPLLTALIGWCPAYVPFGISTCRVRTPKS